MVRILVGGDVCPMGRVQEAFTAGRGSDIFHDLLPEIESADIAVLNLECPLVSHRTPIVKAGPILQAPPNCIRGFVNAQWDILNLANNHSFDHGSAGLNETIEVIRNAGLTMLGAGSSLRDAQMPAVTQVNKQRITIYSMAEREFSVCDENTSGANPLDLISFVQAVRRHKQDGVFIVFVHGGKEYYPYPTPEMIRRSRFMVDMGADAVIWCHTHCPLPWEIYAGRPIVYGLGNLVFEPLGAAQPSWHQGYLARLEIDGCEVRFEPIPYTQSLHAIGATSMNAGEALALRRDLLIRSEELQDDALMASKWKADCQLHRVDYLSMLFAPPPALSRFQRLLMPLHSRKAILQSLLLVQCETHREILETIFSEERARG